MTPDSPGVIGFLGPSFAHLLRDAEHRFGAEATDVPPGHPEGPACLVAPSSFAAARPIARARRGPSLLR
jgi:hypothetical protein